MSALHSSPSEFPQAAGVQLIVHAPVGAQTVPTQADEILHELVDLLQIQYDPKRGERVDRVLSIFPGKHEAEQEYW